MKQATLADEAAALTRAIDLADGRLSDGPITAARQTLQKIGVRSELAPDRTVVALMGATGSGKSSLFNALVGEQLARTAATRPTTRRPLAASWGEGASELLDWLDVPERTLRPDDGSGLVLLDLPDIDSTELDHREIAHRMAEVVDVLVWVLDPQKYADAVVHQQYLQPMAAHAEVTMVVLNQADRVSEAEVASIMRDLRRLLAADGMESVEMHAVSALTGAGVDDLRTRVHAIAASKKARLARAHADLVRAARHLDAAAGGAAAGEITAQNHTRLLEASFRAAGIPAVAAAVRGSHIRRARASVGWPPIRWVARFRPDPLRRLHLDRAVSTPALARTSLPGPTPVQEAAVRASAHALVAGATRELPDMWRSAIQQEVESRIPAVVSALDTAVAGVDYERDRTPWWWKLMGVLQILLITAAVVGAVWLGGLYVMDYLRMPPPVTPMLWEVPWPSALIIGGLGIGALLALLSMAFVRLGASRRAGRVARRLREAVARTIERQLVGPLRTELTDYEYFRESLASVLQSNRRFE
ncbi:MAG: ABC transporter [Actinobacteria bacterium]|nr:ABC transporter [Actinomycetota bacterium]